MINFFKMVDFYRATHSAPAALLSVFPYTRVDPSYLLFWRNG